MADLKPCPFCGGTNTQFQENGRMWTGMRMSEPASVSVRHWCEPEPGQPSRMIERVGRDKDAAIAAWNRREGEQAAVAQTARECAEIGNGIYGPWDARIDPARNVRRICDAYAQAIRERFPRNADEKNS